ncbi:MAG TPA: hypothetical protein VFZ98_09965, partial [Vicinamibacterales bacterium]
MLKTTTLGSALRVAAVVAAVLCPSWVRAQTVTLTVPFRGALSMQVASTTIEFDAASLGGTPSIGVTPSGGTLVTVSVPASPCAGVACQSPGTASNGDDILVTRISGTNRAQIQLTYLSSFGTPYCNYTGGASDRTFTLTLTGF